MSSHEVAKNQLNHIEENPSPMRSQNPFDRPGRQPESNQSFSTARLAAEAFFAQRPEVTELAGSEATIVRPEARVSLPDKSSSPAPDGTADLPRSPTVHRLPAGSISPTEAMPWPEQAASPVAEQAALAEQVVEPAVRSPLRKRRRQLHGEVTIIRVAAAPEVSQPAAATSTPTTAGPVSAARASDTVHMPSAQTFTLMDHTPRYLQLMSRIRALEAAAQQARRREAIEAIRWIKRTIRAHGLTPQDLGLR